MVRATSSNVLRRITTLLIICCSYLSAQGQYGGGSGTPESAWFTGLGNDVGPSEGRVSVSADGSTVVGLDNGQAFRWTAEDGIFGLGYLEGGSYSTALGVSSDGAVIVGYSHSLQGGQAFRWTQDGGMMGLGDLPGGRFYSSAYSTSSDGSIVVGLSRSFTTDYDAFIWDESHGMKDLNLPNSWAYDVSGDGSVVVGRHGSDAFRWTRDDGPTTIWSGTAYGVSSDGDFLVGGTGDVAFRWTEVGGLQSLGDLEGGGTHSVAYSVSLDGSVVGMGTTDSGFEAFIWTEAKGIRSVKGLLAVDCGLDLEGWHLYSAWDISDDGMTIVGRGINPEGMSENWIAVIPEPTTLWLFAFGGLLLRRRGSGGEKLHSKGKREHE